MGTMLGIQQPPHLLTLTPQDGFGFFPAHQAQLIGTDQRYKILRLLGVGQSSYVFLVEDVK